MFSQIKNFFLKIIPNPKNFKDERSYFDYYKLILIGSAFFCIIASYSILRPLKTSVFLGLVGKEYLPITKIFSIIILFPCLLFYSKLVDKLRRYQVVYCFLGFYVIGSIIAAIALAHPVIGLTNTDTNVYRLLGWFFYLFVDLYSSLVVTTFWAFANSICSPDYASKSYGKIVAISRVGGIITAIGSWFVMEKVTIPYATSIPWLLFISAIFLAATLFCVAKIMKKIPGIFLHGYEVVYQIEKQKGALAASPGLFEGLKLVVTKPYVFGIFGIVYSFEAISIILDYQMQVLVSVESNNAVNTMSSYMFLYTATFQALSLVFAVFGTSALLKLIGVRFCLLVMPISTIILMFTLLSYPSLSTIFITLVVLRALNYGFNAPVKEILYIPTTKDIKFKSKAWIESFGRSLSKTSGSMLNLLSMAKETVTFIRFDSIFAIAISVVWSAVAFLVGKKYQDTIKNNDVIGKEEL